jgi:hypothetical protein
MTGSQRVRLPLNVYPASGGLTVVSFPSVYKKNEFESDPIWQSCKIGRSFKIGGRGGGG